MQQRVLEFIMEPGTQSPMMASLNPLHAAHTTMQVGMVQASGLDLGTTLIATGLFNIVSGVAFGIPMCVQPMHTIAALTIASSVTLEQVRLWAVGVCL